jgi:hypothetical protein
VQPTAAPAAPVAAHRRRDLRVCAHERREELAIELDLIEHLPAFGLNT